MLSFSFLLKGEFTHFSGLDLVKGTVNDSNTEMIDLVEAKRAYSFGITEDEKYAYILSAGSNKIFKVNLIEKKVEKSVSVENPYIAGGFMPTTAAFSNYKALNGISINFNYNGFGGTNFTIKATENESVYFAAKTQVADWNNKVLNPTSGKAKFLGWFTDEECTVPANFDSPITNSATFYAKWKEYHHDWKYFVKGDKIFAYCDNLSDGCKYYGKNNAISLTIGTPNTGRMGYTINPSNATNKNVSFESSDTSVATVDKDGNVTGLSKGTAIITVSAMDESGVSTSYTVNTVIPVYLTEIFKDGAYTEFAFGEVKNNHYWRVTFQYSESQGEFILTKIEHKGFFDVGIEQENYTDIKMIPGWTVPFSFFSDNCSGTKSGNIFSFKFNNTYSLEVNTSTKTYSNVTYGGLEEFVLESFSVIDEKGVKTDFIQDLRLDN